MSTLHRPRRAVAAVSIIAPLCALLACASRGAPAPSPAPGNGAPGSAAPGSAAPGTTASGRAAAADSSSVDLNGGKSVERLFTGRFPGVTVSQASNGGLEIRIRGSSTAFGEEPLYVVDGTPLPSGTGGIVYLNPYDIEKIEVLKNPSDVGVYGLRGKNGVVRITTIRPGRR